eukprot:91396_1
MGQQQIRDVFDDNYHQHLVCGYIHRIQGNMFENQGEAYIIPQTIVDLCCMFYYQDFEHLLLWIGSQSCSYKLYNQLQLLNIRNAETFSIIINDLDESKFNKLKTRTNNRFLNPTNKQLKDEFDRYEFGSCIIPNISYTDLPKWMSKKNKSTFQTNKNNMKIFNKNKSIMIRCGGIYSKDNELSNNCDLFIIDNDIQSGSCIGITNDYSNAYYTSLPNLPLKLTSFCLSHYNQEIIVLGGQNENGNTLASIYTLNLNVNKYKHLQWNKLENTLLHYQRFGANSCTINGEGNILVIGGYNFASQSLKSTELLKYERMECGLLKDMNYKRYKPGCIKKSNIFYQVIVGGGRGDEGKNSRRTIEMFDLNKQKWLLYPYKTNSIHTNNPCIWNDKRNENIVYIAGNWIENHTKSSLGFIEYVDIREHNAKWKIINYNDDYRKVNDRNNASIHHLFKLNNVDESKWRSRALIYMS